MLADLRQTAVDVFQVELGVDPIGLRRADQRVQDGSRPPAAVASKEEPVVPAHGDGTQRPLAAGVVDQQPAVVAVTDEGLPLVQCVPARRGKLGLQIAGIPVQKSAWRLAVAAAGVLVDQIGADLPLPTVDPDGSLLSLPRPRLQDPDTGGVRAEQLSSQHAAGHPTVEDYGRHTSATACAGRFAAHRRRDRRSHWGRSPRVSGRRSASTGDRRAGRAARRNPARLGGPCGMHPLLPRPDLGGFARAVSRVWIPCRRTGAHCARDHSGGATAHENGQRNRHPCIADGRLAPAQRASPAANRAVSRLVRALSTREVTQTN